MMAYRIRCEWIRSYHGRSDAYVTVLRGQQIVGHGHSRSVREAVRVAVGAARESLRVGRQVRRMYRDTLQHADLLAAIDGKQS